MTSSESQPRTRAGRELVAWLDLPSLRVVGEPKRNLVFAIEAEAAQDSRPLDVERLASALRNADLSMRDERGRYRNRTPAFWRDMAELLFVLLPVLAAEKPHD